MKWRWSFGSRKTNVKKGRNTKSKHKDTGLGPWAPFDKWFNWQNHFLGDVHDAGLCCGLVINGFLHGSVWGACCRGVRSDWDHDNTLGPRRRRCLVTRGNGLVNRDYRVPRAMSMEVQVAEHATMLLEWPSFLPPVATLLSFLVLGPL